LGTKHAPREVLQDQAAAARRLGISTRTLQRYAKDPGFPDCSAGYDVAAIRQWEALHGKSKGESRNKAVELDLRTKHWRAKQERLKARRMQVQLDEQEGELLPRPAVELAIAQILTTLSDWADQLPDLIGMQCCRKCRDRVEQRLKSEFHSGQETAANLLAAIDAGPRNFRELVEALLASDCRKVAIALHATCLDPDRLPKDPATGQTFGAK
jgi:hypothetical protein